MECISLIWGIEYEAIGRWRWTIWGHCGKG